MWDRQLPMRVQGLVSVLLSFRTNFERGIDNYPFGVEGCTDERKSYLIGATFVTVSRKLRVLASRSLVASLRSSMTG